MPIIRKSWSKWNNNSGRRSCVWILNRTAYATFFFWVAWVNVIQCWDVGYGLLMSFGSNFAVINLANMSKILLTPIFPILWQQSATSFIGFFFFFFSHICKISNNYITPLWSSERKCTMKKHGQECFHSLIILGKQINDSHFIWTTACSCRSIRMNHLYLRKKKSLGVWLDRNWKLCSSTVILDLNMAFCV